MSRKQFWTSAPGILTGIATIITALGGAYAVSRSGQQVEAPGGSLPAPPPSAGAAPTGVRIPESPNPDPGKRAATPVSDWPLVANDTFSGSPTAWHFGTFPDPNFETLNLAFVADTYRWTVAFRQNRRRWFTSPYGPVTDFYAAVDFRAPRSSGEYVNVGLMFGRASNRDYELVISSKGFFALGRSTAEDNDLVIDWTPIRVNFDTRNRMAVLVNDGHMAFHLNDNLIGDHRDPLFSGGTVGLSVEGPTGASAVVEFDNFELRRRPPT